jgi:uncharacterized membrane protein/YHS domain-containing protein
LLINGYHEFSEAGVVPATRQTMALVGPVVRNNSLFLLAIVAIPLFIWLTGKREAAPEAEEASAADRRLAAAKARRARAYRLGAAAAALGILAAVGVAYAQERMPKAVSPPEAAAREGDAAVVPVETLEEGKLHRYGFLTGGRLVRFLVLRTSDEKVRVTLDACEICGPFGYIQEGKQLLCLNCAAEINPFTLGIAGGCNPIPLEAEVTETQVRVPISRLEDVASLFADQPGIEEIDPVCGMRVKMSQAAAFETFGGKTYYFCREECQAKFREDPAAYTDQ